MSTDLILHSPDQAFGLADRIAKSNLVPAAYRGKPVEIAVAMMYGAEIGLPPMTSLNRIIVVEGKPALDAQGMTAVIRRAGHSLSGDSTAQKAVVRGKRRDTGDAMTIEFTMEDAQRAGLASKDNWKKYPKAMLWARAVSQLARDLFSDCLMGFSYVPEEADFDGKHEFSEDGRMLDNGASVSLDHQTPAVEADIAEAEIVGDADPATMSLKALTMALQDAGLSLAGNRAAKEERLREHRSGTSVADPETGEIVDAEVVDESRSGKETENGTTPSAGSGESASASSPDTSPAGSRVYLDVTFKEKEEAKAAGARWDKDAKSWYIPEGADPIPLLRWVKDDGDGEDVPTLLDGELYADEPEF